MLHFGYPIPILRSLFGALLMLYMLFLLGPLKWWQAQQKEEERERDDSGHGDGGAW